MSSDTNKKQNHGLLSFRVNKVHGDRDISIDLTSNVKIIIADNGAGKTTLINLLVGVLTGEMSRLQFLDFESIELQFEGRKPFIIAQADLPALVASPDLLRHPRWNELRMRMGSRAFDELVEFAGNARSPVELRTHRLFDYANAHFSGPTSQFIEELNTFAGSARLTPDQQARRAELRELVAAKFPFEPIFWPTFRRVEEDLRNLGLGDEARGLPRQRFSQLINFGMRDVEEQIKSFTDGIRNSTLRQYQTTSARMLDQLALNPYPSQAQVQERLSRTQDLNLILARLASIISPTATSKIIQLVQSGEILSPTHSTLAFLLSNLVTIYDETKRRDEEIRTFVSVVSNYLQEKLFVYDDINVSLEMNDTRSKRPLQLSKLSSGEKQVISLLSRVYLGTETRGYAVFIDEPELSLSPEWQRRLLPDILASGRCRFLLAATHSPFIFDNNLDRYTEALKVDFVKPST
jgi:predicted ATPase